MTYFVAYNVLSGSILEVSEDELYSEGHPVMIKSFEGDIPDPIMYAWNRGSLSYERKSIKILTHIQFRKLFTPLEEISVDTFNDTYQTLPYLSNDQKAMIRTGLKKYAEAQGIDLSDSGVDGLLSLYVAVGVISSSRKQQILNGEFQQ